MRWKIFTIAQEKDKLNKSMDNSRHHTQKAKIARVPNINREGGWYSREYPARLSSQLQENVFRSKKNFCGKMPPSLLTSAPDNFWRYISLNQKRKLSSEISASELNSFFEFEFTTGVDNTPQFPTSCPSVQWNINITVAGILNLLNNLNTNILGQFFTQRIPKELCGMGHT